jgi:hypothetical protein
MNRSILGLLLGLLLFPTLSFAGTTESKLEKLAIGMSPEEIIQVLGKPDLRREEGVNADGKAMERLRYNVTRRLKEPTGSGDLEETYSCSLTLTDGLLARIDRER